MLAALPHAAVLINNDQTGPRFGACAPSDPAPSHTSQSSTLPTLACAQLVNEGRFPGAVKFKPAPAVCRSGRYR